MVYAVPAPFVVKGVSTYYNKDGRPSGQWVKSRLDAEQYEGAIRAAVEALAEDVVRVAPSEEPKVTEASLCNLYTLTDCHVGMRSWPPETGQKWDLAIAERVLIGAFSYAIKASPNAESCVVNQLGDFIHFDSLLPLTPTDAHVLDSDGRYGKVIRVATRILRFVIDLALQKHKRVVVLMAEGNHDMASSVWLRHLFSLLYENEPRVDVIDSELPYYVHQHGETMLAFHHGHLSTKDKLPLLFAAQFPKVWGETKKRYCHVGHMHHLDEKEHPGMTVIQHPTIAARDSYASRRGYYAEREIFTVTYHSKYGQVARTNVVPEMIGE